MDELVRWRVGRGQVGLRCSGRREWCGHGGVDGRAGGDRQQHEHRRGDGEARVRQLVGSSRLDGEPVQAVLPRGMLEVGAIPKEHFGSLLSSVQVKGARSTRPRGRGGKKTRRKAERSTKFDGLDSDAIGSLVRDEVMATVLELLGDDTGEDTAEVLDPTAPLMEAGLDSLAATQLVRSLSESLEVELSPTVLFDHPTVDALVAHEAEPLVLTMGSDAQIALLA